MAISCILLADKDWKRRFFQEKKLTSNLEDQIKQAKKDLHVMHSKVDQERGTHLKGLWNYSHIPGSAHAVIISVLTLQIRFMSLQ